MLFYTRWRLFLVIGLAATGCQIIKPYQSPLTPTPEEWKSPAQQNGNLNEMPAQWKGDEKTQVCAEEEADRQAREEAIHNLGNWWLLFNDSVLNQLEEQAIANNYDLWAAFETVIQAREQALMQRAALFPSLYFSPAFSRSRMLIMSPFNLAALQGGTAAAPTPTPLSSSAPSMSTSHGGLPPNVLRFFNAEYILPFNFQYEVDLWSQLHNSYYSAVFHAQAAAENYFNILLSVTSEVAVSYFRLRDFDFQQDILIRTIKARKVALEINRDRFQAGIIPYLDVSRAEVQLYNAEYDSIDISRMRGLEENRLATLIGVPASVFKLDPNPIRTPPPTIPSGLPSELLCRRPDIRAAERNLASAYSQIGVAYAGFFPSLNLNATVGLESPVTSILFDWKAKMWQIGAQVAQLIFDAGLTEANVQYAISVWREQFDHYQEAVLKAFQEVEDALVNINQREKESGALSESVRYGRMTLDLSYIRYKQGLVTYLDVTDAERDLLQSEQTYAIVLGERYTSLIKLIQALGGSWDDGSDGDCCEHYHEECACKVNEEDALQTKGP